MSSTITEVAAFGATVTKPDDGDPATAASITDSGVGFQEVTNRTRFLVEAIDGELRGGYLHCAGDGVVRVSAIQSLIVGTDRGVKSTVTVLTPGSGGVPSLSASTDYFVYAYPDGAGGVSFEVDTVGPDVSVTWKTGGTTRRYLGHYRSTIAGTKIIPFRQTAGGVYIYDSSLISEGDTEILEDTVSHTTDTTPKDTTVTRSLWPAHCQEIKLGLEITDSSGITNTHAVRAGAGITGNGAVRTFRMSAADTVAASMDITTTTTGFNVRTVSTAGSGTTFSVKVFVEGFYERDTR